MKKIYASQSKEVTDRERRHMELSRRAACDCAVLLENDGMLPLPSGKKLALYGNGAAHTVKGGTGSGDVNTRTDIGICQGLEEAGFAITTKDWLQKQRQKRAKEKQEYLAQYAEHPLDSFLHPFQEPSPAPITEEDLDGSDTDTAIYVIARISGEGTDRSCKRGDYLLYEEEEAQLRQLTQHYAHVAVILNIGGVIDLAAIQAMPGIGAVLLMGQLGNAGGHALADLLSGKVTPSGKLTDTWAKAYCDYPSSAEFSHNNGNLDDEYYTDGIYVGYRYFDAFGIEPAYCFGYGKSYADFRMEVQDVVVHGERVDVRVLVTNTSEDFSGKEVAQLYYCAPAGKLDKPCQELAAFAKTSLLRPGMSETLTLSCSIRQMASYSTEEAAWVLEAGEYLLRIGNSSRNTMPAAILHLGQTVQTEIVKNCFPGDCKLEEISPGKAGVADAQAKWEHAPAADAMEGMRHAYGANGMGPAGHASAQMWSEIGKDGRDLPRLELDAGQIHTITASYQGKREPYTTAKQETLTLEDVRNGRCAVEELVAQLSIEELAQLCVGTLRAEEGSVVGNASYLIPGAAGDTTSALWESRGIKNLILADGPAGLRLQPIFKTTKAGELIRGGMVMGDVYEPFDPSYPEEDTDTYYQYCTAIPIGWSLAQSWDMALLEQLGDMVGREMELFGIDLWLAPALNIHRNPLCGRNFEYYSEDPLVSGKAAAAITRGVQSHPGKGTTIKHFAANNQEDNRYYTNAHVGERALREIYLKGFEIAVKESAPMSIMTSYNLLNGTHTANHYGLLQSVARDEWGYGGVVMTDWYTSQKQPGEHEGALPLYPFSASTGCAYAGNDIQMPGCQKNVDDLVEAARSGDEIDGYRVTLADLQFCAANVIRAVLKTM